MIRRGVKGRKAVLDGATGASLGVKNRSRCRGAPKRPGGASAPLTPDAAGPTAGNPGAPGMAARTSGPVGPLPRPRSQASIFWVHLLPDKSAKSDTAWMFGKTAISPMPRVYTLNSMHCWYQLMVFPWRRRPRAARCEAARASPTCNILRHISAARLPTPAGPSRRQFSTVPAFRARSETSG